MLFVDSVYSRYCLGVGNADTLGLYNLFIEFIGDLDRTFFRAEPAGGALLLIDEAGLPANADLKATTVLFCLFNGGVGVEIHIGMGG